MKRQLKNYLCILLTCLLAACEMPLGDDYYKDIPHEETIPMSIDLNALTDGQSILITQATKLEYALTAFGKDIGAVQFTMGSKKWDSVSLPFGSLPIDPVVLPNGYYTLTCNLYVKSNSGSVADQLDNEYYVGSFSWPVLIDYDMEIPKLFTSQITPEKHLKLQWSMPVFSHLKVESYRLDYYRHGSLERSIQLGVGETSYIDPLYAGEKGEYHLNVVLKDPTVSENSQWQIGSLALENSIKTSSFISPSGESIFSWECPYRNSVTLQINEQSIQMSEEQTSITIPHKPLGSDYWERRTNVRFSVFPYNTTLQPVYSTDEKIYHYATCLSGYNSRQTWNKTENQLYILDDRQLRSYQLPGYGLTAETTIDSDYLYEMCSSPNSSTIAISCGPLIGESGEYILLYGGKKLNLICRISCESSIFNGNVRNRKIFLTSDNKLVYFLKEDNKLIGVVRNATNGAKEKTFEIETPYDYWYLTLSEDGKWLAYTLGNQTSVVELDNYEVKNQRFINDFINTEYYFFNPKNIHELGIAVTGEITFRNLDTNQDTRILTLPNSGNCYNVDPLNGNINSTAGYERYILTQEGKLLFQVPSDSYSQLMGNILTNNEGLVLNLTPYLKQ